jgi:hypothetical protein
VSWDEFGKKSLVIDLARFQILLTMLVAVLWLINTRRDMARSMKITEGDVFIFVLLKGSLVRFL